MQRLAVLPIFVLFAMTACAEDSAPAGLYKLGGAEKSICPRPVQLLNAPPPEAFEEVASLSATCPYTSPNTCDRRLLARACELATDAVVIQGGKVTGRKAKPQLAEDAVAIRFSVETRVP